MVFEDQGVGLDDPSVRLSGVEVEVAGTDQRVRSADGTGAWRFELPPGETLTLQPGSDHLMFFELDGPWKVGEEIPLVLHFESAPNLRLTVPVEPMSAHR